MSTKLICLMTGLLWAASTATHARELATKDPARMPLVDLARDTPAAGLPADSRLSLSRVWVDGTQAKVCAAARTRQGELLVQDGQLQMKLVKLQKQGARWRVQHAARVAMGPGQDLDAACGEASADSTMAAAIKLLETNPPTAGIRTDGPKGPAAMAMCHDAPSGQASSEQAAPGVVQQAGRSLLHSAPDSGCYMGKFIVQGDQVTILNRVAGWARVRYTHPLTHVTTIGWLRQDQVKPNQPDRPESLTAQN